MVAFQLQKKSKFNLTKTRKTLLDLYMILVCEDIPTVTWVQCATRTFRMMESLTQMKMSRAAFTWRTNLVHKDKTSRPHSLQPWLQLHCILQQLVTVAQEDLRDDCPITITLTLLLKTMVTTTKTSTMLDIHSILTSKQSSPESKSPLKTIFSKSLKQKSVEVGKFQNVNLAPNALLPTVSTNF
jgi:hypothetical protein